MVDEHQASQDRRAEADQAERSVADNIGRARADRVESENARLRHLLESQSESRLKSIELEQKGQRDILIRIESNTTLVPLLDTRVASLEISRAALWGGMSVIGVILGAGELLIWIFRK